MYHVFKKKTVYFAHSVLFRMILKVWSRDSSVGIAMGWTAGVRFPAGARDSSLLHSAQAGSGSHPASYPIGTGGKAAGA
jgi:hypothetical protein